MEGTKPKSSVGFKPKTRISSLSFDDENDEPVVPVVAKASIKKPSTTKLSFGDEYDDGDDKFEMKKKPVAAKSKANRAAQDFVEQVSQKQSTSNSEYSTEALMELQKATYRRNTVSVPVPGGSRTISGDDVDTTDYARGPSHHIPDATEIQLLKEKRHRRTAGADHDQDAHEGEFADPETQRIAFGDPRVMERQARIQRKILAETVQVDDLDDEEQRAWESQQIRSAAPSKNAFTDVRQYQGKPASMPGSLAGSAFASSQPTAAMSLPPPISAPPVSIDAIQQRIKEAIVRARGEHDVNVSQMRKVDTDLAQIKLSHERLTAEMDRDKKRYDFYMKLKEYMLDLIACLDEKGDVMASLQERWLRANTQYTKIVIARSQEGFDRLVEAAKAKQSVDTRVDLAESDAEELRLDRQQLTEMIAVINEEASHMFEDTKEEFSEISHIAKWFEDWRSGFYTEYSKAYVGLCLPSVFGIFVKREMLNWDMFTKPKIDDMLWFRDLFNFAQDDLAEKHHIAGTEDSDDSNLIPLLVEKVVAPHLANVFAQIWNPLSAKQTRAVSTLVGDVIDILDSSTNPAAKKLLDTVINKVSKFIEDYTFPLIPPASHNPSLYASLVDVSLVRFNTLVKLASNIISLASASFPEGIVQHLVCSRIIVQLFVPFLKQLNLDTLIHCCERIFAMMPKQWTTPSPAQALFHYQSFLQETSDKVAAGKYQLGNPDTLGRFLNVLRQFNLEFEAKNVEKAYSVRK